MTQAQIERIEERLNKIDTEQAYLEMLDECYETVEICGHTYDAGYALKEIDPVAFRCGHADYISSMLDDEWIEVSGEFYLQTEVQELLEEFEMNLENN
jgi:hypothetical protein